jgi:hypothetical protein
MNRNQRLCALTKDCQNEACTNYPNDDGFHQIPIDNNDGMAQRIPGSSLWFENRFNFRSHTALSLRKGLPLDYGTLESDIPTTNVSELQQTGSR